MAKTKKPAKRKTSKSPTRKKEEEPNASAAASRLESDFQASGLPDYLETQRTRVFCGADSNTSAKYFGSAHTFASKGFNFAQNGQDFHESLNLVITQLDSECIEFDLIGVSPSFANALRRILISEVPTMAIEHVFFLNNTSTIPDEILAHRLGLIPIHADPGLFKFRGETFEGDENDQKNTIVLGLKFKCTHPTNSKKVLSKELVWMPKGSKIPEEANVHFSTGQDEIAGMQAIKPVHEDILLAKLSLGQEIELEAHCTKGVGAEHAKWSPVATAWYRLCPEVVLLEDVVGEKADQLMSKFPEDINPFRIEGSGQAKKVVVKEGKPHLECLERVRALSADPDWSDSVQLRKIKNHFIFTIESTGAISPEDLLVSALDILRAKSQKTLELMGEAVGIAE